MAPLPKLQQALACVRVLSARERHGRTHPGDPVLWKCTFAELKENSRDRKPGRGRGSGAGDARSRPPREAHTSFVKTVRLVSAPVVLELQKQLDTLTPKIATIVGQVRHPAVRPPS